MTSEGTSSINKTEKGSIIQNIVFIFIQDTVTVPQKRRRTGVEKKLAEVVGFFPPADQEFDNINYEDMRGVGFDGGEVAEGGGGGR